MYSVTQCTTSYVLAFIMCNCVVITVWEKFTIGYLVKIVCGKIYSSCGICDEHFFTNIIIFNIRMFRFVAHELYI